jgi:hypothetical protein
VRSASCVFVSSIPCVRDSNEWAVSDYCSNLNPFRKSKAGRITMKNQQTKKRLMQFLIVLAAFGFYSMAQAQRVNHTVQMRLNDLQTEVKFKTVGKCANDNHNGCIEVARGTQGRLKLTLVADNTSQCNRPGGKKWEVGEVYLGGKGSLTKPNSWGGFQSDSEVKADFNFVNATTGQLKKESGSNANSIVVFDENMALNWYNIWYKVTILCVDSDGEPVDKLVADPRIKNGGRQ